MSGPEGLMDDLYLSEEFWCTPSTDFGDAGVQHTLFQIQISSSLSIDDIFSRLLTLTSYLTHKLIRFIEDLVFTDIRRYSEDSVVTCDQEVRSACDGDSGCPDGTSTSSRYWDPSKGLLVPENTDSEFRDLTVSSSLENVENDYSSGSINVVFSKGLVLPTFFLRFARRLVLTSWSLVLSCIRCAQANMLRFISRVRRSVRGSSDDIGWLQNDTEMAPVEDGSSRFLELLQAIRNGEHKLPDSFIYLLIPAILVPYTLSAPRGLSLRWV